MLIPGARLLLQVSMTILALGTTLPSQSRWRLILPTVRPAARNLTSLAFDRGRSTTVLFGGRGDFAVFADTWEWDGTIWLPLNPPTTPPARGDHGLVYDFAHQRVVLFGGADYTFSTHYNDTWLFDGVDWQLQSPAVAPSPRSSMPLAFDHVRGTVLAFGGAIWRPGQIQNFDDTWEWDGGNWTQLFPAHRPSARGGHVMVGDPGRRRVVMCSGGTSLATASGDTWVWDGSDWGLDSGTGMNPTLWPGQLTFDVRRNLVAHIRQYFLFIAPLYLDVHWFADTTGGSNLIGGGTIGPALAYDEVRDELVQFGGYFDGCCAQSSTWLYRPDYIGYSTPFGTGCAGGLGVPALTGTRVRPQFTLDLTATNAQGYVMFTLGFDTTSWNNAQLPLDLAPFGMPGCHAYIRPEHTAATTAGANGVASISMRVPNDTSLINVAVFAQTLVASPGTNALGAVASNGLRVVIGRW